MPNFLVHSDKTDVGRVRSANEDFHLIPDVPNHHCYIVCDGMGGHVGGAAASKMAASVFAGSLTAQLAQGERVSKAMDLAIRECNAAVYNRTLEEPELKGMGTTIVAMVVDDCGEVHVGHVGDSRIYRFRGGELQQLTRDDSYVQDLIDRGALREEDREKHPDRSRITKAIGIDGIVEPTVRYLGAWQPGDRYLLCSDGLTGVVEDDDLAKEARTDRSQAVAQLLGKALMAGAPDNVTLILVEAEGTSIPQPTGSTKQRVVSILTRTDWFAPNWAWLASGGLSLALLLVFIGPSLLNAIWPGDSEPEGLGVGGFQYVCLDESACNYFDQDTVRHNARGGGACRYDLNPCLNCEGGAAELNDSLCVQLDSTMSEVLRGDLELGCLVYYEVLDGDGAPNRWAPDGTIAVSFKEVLWTLDIKNRKIVSAQPAPLKKTDSNSVPSGANKPEKEESRTKSSISSETKKTQVPIKPKPKAELNSASVRMIQNRISGVEIRGFGKEARLWNSQGLAELSVGKLQWVSDRNKDWRDEKQTVDVSDGRLYQLREQGDTLPVIFDMKERGSVSSFSFEGLLQDVEDFEFIYYNSEKYFGLLEMISDRPFLLTPGSNPSRVGRSGSSTSEVDYALFKAIDSQPILLLEESREKRPGRVVLEKYILFKGIEELEATWKHYDVRSWSFVHTPNGQWVSGWTGEGPFWEDQFLSSSDLRQQTLALDEECSTFLSLERENWQISLSGELIGLELTLLEESGALRHVSWDEKTGVLVMVFDKCVYTGKVETP